ncbi:hypothetical protein J2Y69_002487 [Microbacterium resistens]|uniref:Transcriptional regulator n=1 Tax=Microbacterium resistens TaxID=156977 RepID=A0ABU1SE64_9MICO|nr:hypothetical protein [Microbacterium resistens]
MKTREQKRAEAVRRQEFHDALPGYDKLAKIAERPGKSERERARILGAVAEWASRNSVSPR